MGTIAARDCLRVLELTEQVAAALLLRALPSAATIHPGRPVKGWNSRFAEPPKRCD
jgi:histidine ammonia-lyase